MNILIVDDDRFVIASLLKGIPWSDLGFHNVFTAYNITDAKSILKKEPVDLLLSDIDMPNGNGLDLLAWIRETHNDLPVIFLTNYADFDYARKALTLKTFDYFLKPIEFDKLIPIIQKATQQLTRQQNQRNMNCEIFWHSLLHDKIADTEAALYQFFEQSELPYKTTDYFLPVVFDLSSYQLTSQNQLSCRFSDLKQQFNYVKTTFEAIFAEQFTPVDVLLEYSANSSRYLAVFCLDTNKISPLLPMNCENFVAAVYAQMHCALTCFVGLPSRLDTFRPNLKKLREMIANSLDCNGKVLFLSEYRPVFTEHTPCDVKTLEFYLENKQYTAFTDYCKQYLQRLSDSGQLHSSSINSFQIDVVQTLYAFLRDKGILANKLFHDNSYHILSRNAKNSSYNMLLYIQYIIHTIRNYLETASDERSISRSMQAYVDEHYAEDISRSDLSDIFYLDPDYASKLFKKETGISFKNYIIMKRIEVAKNLLINTDLPINTISDNVGYGNYSYFTRLFKKVTGQTPVDYRRDT